MVDGERSEAGFIVLKTFFVLKEDKNKTSGEINYGVKLEMLNEFGTTYFGFKHFSLVNGNHIDRYEVIV